MKNPHLAVCPLRANGNHPDHTLRSTAWWARHFQADLERDWGIPWDCIVSLTEDELARVAGSVADFQRGESSEARNYLGKSAAYSAENGDPSFHVVSQRFVAAENLHADLLLRFMVAAGIPVRREFMTDRVFRWLRSCQDLAWASRIILVAELVAQDFYACLRDATRHPVLRRICDRVLAEEAAHVRFQIERIARIEAGAPRWRVAWRDIAQTCIMVGTIAVVFGAHGSVLRARFTLWGFAAAQWSRNRRALAGLRRLRTAGVPANQGVAAPARGVSAGAGAEAGRAGLRGSFSSRTAAS